MFKSEIGFWILWLEPISKLNGSLQVSDIHQTFCQDLNILLDREDLHFSPTQDILTCKWEDSVTTKCKVKENLSWEGNKNHTQNFRIFIINGTNALFFSLYINNSKMKRSSKYNLLNKPYTITVFSTKVVYPTAYAYPIKSTLTLKLSRTKTFVTKFEHLSIPIEHLTCTSLEHVHSLAHGNSFTEREHCSHTSQKNSRHSLQKKFNNFKNLAILNFN